MNNPGAPSNPEPQDYLLSEVWVGGFQYPFDEGNADSGWHWVNEEGVFPSSNNDPSGYANWLTSEPNDAYGPGSEQYLAINLLGQWGWNDEGNVDLVAGFVIEYEDMAPIPVPSTLILVALGLCSLLNTRRRTR